MERIGHFIVYRALQRGGMGRIDVAYNLRADRMSVLKRNLVPEQLERFRHEMEISKTLAHPHLVPVLEVGAVEAQPYIELAYLAGKNLETLARRASPLPPSVALAIADQVSDALLYAHAEVGLRFVHRDISPPNILVTYSGTAHLLDYGLSLSALKQFRTGVGLRPGTPGFASPEQLLGRPLDARSDIYSLGAVLWYLLTGQRLFTVHSSEQEIFRPAPRVGSLRGDIDPELDTFVASCLEQDPSARFQSMAELRFALQALDGAGSATDVLAELLTRYYPDGEAEWRAEAAEVRRLARAMSSQSAKAPQPAPNGEPEEEPLAPARSSHRAGAVLALLLLLLTIAVAGWVRTTHRPRPIAVAQAAPPSPQPVAVELPPAPSPEVAPPPPPAPPTQPVVAPVHAAPKRPRRARGLTGQDARDWADARRDLAAGRYRTAESTFDRFSSSPALHAWGELGLAELHLARKSYDAALKQSTEALRSGAEDTKVEALLLRAEVQVQLGNCDAATRDLRQVLKLTPGNMAAAARLSRIEAECGAH